MEVVGEYGIWIGWFAYERLVHRRVVCYLKELAIPGRSSPSLAGKVLKMSEHHKI